MGEFKITCPFKVMASVGDIYFKGEYQGTKKTGEVIELKLTIEGGWAEDIKGFLKKTDGGSKKQAVTITVVP